MTTSTFEMFLGCDHTLGANRQIVHCTSDAVKYFEELGSIEEEKGDETRDTIHNRNNTYEKKLKQQ